MTGESDQIRAVPPMAQRFGLSRWVDRLDVDNEPPARCEAFPDVPQRLERPLPAGHQGERARGNDDRVEDGRLAEGDHVRLEQHGVKAMRGAVVPADREHVVGRVVAAHPKPALEQRNKNPAGSHGRFQDLAANLGQQGPVELDVPERGSDWFVQLVNQRAQPSIPQRRLGHASPLQMRTRWIAGAGRRQDVGVRISTLIDVRFEYRGTAASPRWRPSVRL